MTLLVQALQHDTLDLLCHRHLGITTGVVEKALELNRGTFGVTETLSTGQLIRLPDKPAQKTTKAPMINLWE